MKAPRGALFVEAELTPGDWVSEGRLLGHLLGDGHLSSVPVLRPISGRLRQYGCRREDCDVSLAAMHAYASEGDLLAAVAAPGETPSVP